MNPNDPLFPEQKWVLDRLGVPAAWACMTPDAPEIVVAVVDSGVADNHEDLQPLTAGTVVERETRDDEDHGTLVAGTIGAIRDNNLGIAGAAKVRIYPVKFCSAQFLPNADRGAAAIRMATAAGAKVIVLAWDVGYDTAELKNAIADAGDARNDAVVVVAAGNHSLDNDIYPNWPANHGEKMSHVITVMATDEQNERASSSNFGKKTVHIAAPAFKPEFDVLSTVPYFHLPITGASYSRGYRRYRGTSAAAAYVAGLAALIRAKHPSWNAKKVKKHLIDTAEPVKGLKRFCEAGGIASYARAICGPNP